MVGFFGGPRCGPIGIDIGSRSVKLMQLTADHVRVWEAARWDLATGPTAEASQRDAQIALAIQQAREGRNFRGRDAVFCLGPGQLFVQNLRVPQASGDELNRVVCAEAAGRLPFARDEAEIRFLEGADVRQGDTIRREVILLACHRPVLDGIVALADMADLAPAAIDAEPSALLRCYAKQYRRDDDQQQCAMLVNLGASSTAVVIARGAGAVFIKYVDIGGRQFDEAVARHLKLSPADAASLRRHNGDRRSEQRDPEITRSITESIRPVLERLASELSMCIRYYSVTFRGQPLARVVLGGGEATQSLAEWLSKRLDIGCELGDPLRSFQKPNFPGRIGQWDVAAGLALREIR
ncbi:MAG: pilus assembly protein PilM [Pirellulales bacterium]|nr:pilus assembly protein PilM [Pirellulales bacterium]